MDKLPDQCIDTSLCLELCNGNPKLASQLLLLLKQELPQQQLIMNTARKQADLSAFREEVHKLYNCCCYCGVPSVKTVCTKLERTINKEQKFPPESDINTLNAAIDELLSWLGKININELFINIKNKNQSYKNK